jgi:thioester reductase-like protein
MAALLCTEFQTLGTQAGLQSFEIPRAVRIEHTPFSIENGLLTSSQKVNRRAIGERFRSQLAQLYDVPDIHSKPMENTADSPDIQSEQPASHIDSLASVEILAHWRKKTGKDISLQAWFQSETPLASLTLPTTQPPISSLRDMVQADLNLDLSATLSQLPDRESSPSKVSVLLTGATGFLGRHLLEALLQFSDYRVLCLVRSKDEADGKARIVKQLQQASIHVSTEQMARITIVPGDLELPQLGLDTHQWHQLATTITAIYHSGAKVNWLSPYWQVRKANVSGTCELLRLTQTNHPKTFHFISTISTNYANRTEEHCLTQELALQSSGYGLSKWVAEQLVSRAQKQGVSVKIYRPSMITGHSQTGDSNPTDYVNRYLCGSLLLEKAFDSDEHVLDMTPVDFVSKAVVLLSQHPSPTTTFHLTNVSQAPTYRQLALMLRELGYPQTLVDYKSFVRCVLQKTLPTSRPNPIWPLQAYFPDSGFALPMGPWPATQTNTILQSIQVIPPKPDSHLVRIYLESLQSRGHLRPR